MLENLDLFSANGAQAPASSLYDILGVGILVGFLYRHVEYRVAT